MVREELKQMEKSRIIEQSSRDWASPIALVQKKDETLRIRMCIHYRRLNVFSQVDAFPMPRIDDLIDRQGDGKYVTTLDLHISRRSNILIYIYIYIYIYI